LNKKRPASSVNAAQEVWGLISTFPEGSDLKNNLEKAKSALYENIFAGRQVEKDKIPFYYVKKYGVNNLFVYRLNSNNRLIYTLVADANGISVNIIDVFLSHKLYEKRFGYS
jgi:hypothetical protein